MLGVIIGSMALQGRDKLTLITPAPLDTLGLWVEQLIAESTGKEGKGVIPIAWGENGFREVTNSKRPIRLARGFPGPEYPRGRDTDFR